MLPLIFSFFKEIRAKLFTSGLACICSLLPNPAPPWALRFAPASCTLLWFSLHLLLSQGWGVLPFSSCWGQLGPETATSGDSEPCLLAAPLVTLCSGPMVWQTQATSLLGSCGSHLCPLLPNTTVEHASLSLSGRLKAQRGGETYLREHSNLKTQLPAYSTGKFVQIIQNQLLGVSGPVPEFL